MEIKEGVNRVLSRTTGYHLTRGVPAGPAPPAPPARRGQSAGTPSASTQPTGTQPAGKQPAGKPAAPKRPTLPADYDEATREIITRVRSRTMTGHAKIHFLVQAVRYIVEQEIPGGVLECGVWRGGSMLAVAHTLVGLGVTDRELYLLDTFEGMSEPTERDQHLVKGKSAEAMLADQRGAPIWQAASLQDVHEGFADVDYPAERLHFVPGKVEETIPAAAPEQLALLRLDTDWYESTRHELAHLYQRLAPGGVLIIDDYGSWQGSKDATDEFLARTGEPLLLTRIGRGRVAVKPGLRSRV